MVVGLWVVGGFVAGFGWLGPSKNAKNLMVFASFCQRGGGARPSNIGNASCLATQPWAIFADRRNGLEQINCTRERGSV
mgnify:CR=1 FL=1